MRKIKFTLALVSLFTLSTLIFFGCDTSQATDLKIDIPSTFATTVFDDQTVDFNNLNILATVNGKDQPIQIGSTLQITGKGVSKEGILNAYDMFSDLDDTTLTTTQTYTLTHQNLTKTIDITANKRIESASITGSNFTRELFVGDQINQVWDNCFLMVTFVSDFPATAIPLTQEIINITTATAGEFDLIATIGGYHQVALGKVNVSYYDEVIAIEEILTQPTSIEVRAGEGAVFAISTQNNPEQIQNWQELGIFNDLSPNTKYYVFARFINHEKYGTTDPAFIEITTTRHNYDVQPQLTQAQIGSTHIAIYPQDYDYPIEYKINNITATPQLQDGLLVFDSLLTATEYTITAQFTQTQTHNASQITSKSFTTKKLSGTITAVGFTQSTQKSTEYNGQFRQVGYIQNSANLPVSDFVVRYYDQNNNPLSHIKNAGTYKIEVDTTSPNHYMPTYFGELTITKKQVTINHIFHQDSANRLSFENTALTDNKIDYTPTNTNYFNIIGLATGDSITDLTFSIQFTNSQVGEFQLGNGYQITKIAQNGIENYQIAQNQATDEFGAITANSYIQITNSQVQIRIESQTIYYGDTPTFDYTILKGEIDKSVDLQLEYSQIGTDVGNYTLSATSLNPNYTINIIPATITILPATITAYAISGTDYHATTQNQTAFFNLFLDGFMFSQTQADLDLTRLSFFANAQPNQQLQITPTGLRSSNYIFSYQPKLIDSTASVSGLDYSTATEYLRHVGTVNTVQIRIAPQYQSEEITLIAKTVSGNAFATFQNLDATFTGDGIVEIYGTTASGILFNSTKFLVTKNAINASTPEQLGSTVSGLVCLQNDLTLSTRVTVTTNGILYGNGHSITSTTSSFINHNSYFVYLQGRIENLKVINFYLEDYYSSGSVGNDYYKTAATIYTNGDNAVIENCYIEGGKSAIYYITGTGNTRVSNTTINGGAVSISIQCSGDMTLLFENITIIQIPTEGKKIGIGFLVNENSTPNIVFKGDNHFYTYLDENGSEILNNNAKKVYDLLWNRPEIQKLEYNGKEYIVYMIAVFEAADGYHNANFDQSTHSQFTLKQSSVTMSQMGATASATMISIDAETHRDYLIDFLTNKVNNVPEFSFVPTAYNITASGTDQTKRFNYQQEQNSISIDLASTIPVGFTKFGENLSYSTSIEYLVGTGEGIATITNNTLNVQGGRAWFNLTYTVIDHFNNDQITTYTNTIYVNSPTTAPVITLVAQNQEGGAYDFDDSEIQNFSNLNLNGVPFMKKADVDGIISYDQNAYYRLTLAKDFIVTATAFNEDGQEFDVTSSIVLTYSGTKSQTTTEILLAKEDKPANSTEKKTRRFSAVFTISLSATYEGQTTTQNFSIAYWVPEGVQWSLF